MLTPTSPTTGRGLPPVAARSWDQPTPFAVIAFRFLPSTLFPFVSLSLSFPFVSLSFSLLVWFPFLLFEKHYFSTLTRRRRT